MRKIDIEMPYANKKLLELIEIKADGKVQKFAKMIGLSQQRINRLFVRDKRNQQYPKMTDDVKKVVIEHFGLDKTFFMPYPAYEEVDPYSKLFGDFAPPVRNETTEKNIETRPRIPTMAMAGNLSMYIDSVGMADCEYMPIIQRFPSYDFTMFIKGNSMEPKFEGGDEIACKRVYDVIEWGHTYVIDTKDGAVVKKVFDAGDKIRCVSYNSDEYPDFFIDKDIINGFYKIVGLIRI